MTLSRDPIPPALLDLHSDRTRRTCLNVVIAFVLLGSVGRVKQYVSRPSYWNDEAAVVANVIHRDCRQLLERLDYAQAAPPLFLWAERGVYRTFGSNEFALRFLPLCLGLLSLPLFARLAWRVLPATSAVWATGWFCLFQKILHGAHYVKQYSGDLCVAIVLLSMVFGRDGKVSSRRRMGQLSVAAALLLWFSFPVVFLYAALALVLLPDCLRAGRGGVLVWVGGGAVAMLSFLALHHVALSHGGDPTLVEFWHDSFPELRHPLTIPRWLAREVYGLFAYPFDSLGFFTTLLAALGAVALWKLKQRRLLAVLPVALAVAFVAAALQKYPFPGRHRLGLYLVPLAILILGAGAEGQNVTANPWLCRGWWVLALPLLVLEAGQLVKDLATREQSSTTREVVQYVRANRQPDEPIYLVGDSLAPFPPSGRSAEFLCYWPEPPGKVGVGFSEPRDIREGRFWLVYSLNRPETDGPPFSQQLLKLFGPGIHVVRSCQPRRQSGAMLVARE